MAKGINTAFSNAQRVRVGDYGSTLEIELINSEEAEVQEVEWVRIYPVDKPEITQFIEAEDFTVENNTVYIILPEIPRGQYNIEVKDDAGRLYPAEGNIRLQMVQSTNEAVEVYYVNYRDLILEDATPIIEDYLISNSDVFRGEKGDAFTWEDLTEEQKQELRGLDGDNGINGLSAYEVALESGFDGSETEWLDSLIGKDGEDGERGERGSDGKDFTYEDFTDEQLEDLKLKVVEAEFDEDGNTIVSLTDGSSFTVNKGPQGVQGERGLQGEQGVQGEQGIQGEQGDKGDRGEQGEQGIQGEAGYTPVKDVDYFDGKDGADGLSFDYDSLTEEQKAEIKGEKGDSGLKGDKGDKGEDGYTPVKGVDYFDGTDGKDFVFSDFTTEQLEDLKLKIVDTEFDSDGNTLVTFTDDSEITVNRGLKGEQGETGDQGIQGERGEKGDRGEQGVQGIQGDKGEQGADGLHGNTVSLTENEDGTYTLINTDPNSGEEIKRVVLHNREDSGGSKPKEWQTLEIMDYEDRENAVRLSTNGEMYRLFFSVTRELIEDAMLEYGERSLRFNISEFENLTVFKDSDIFDITDTNIFFSEDLGIGASFIVGGFEERYARQSFVAPVHISIRKTPDTELTLHISLKGLIDEQGDSVIEEYSMASLDYTGVLENLAKVYM